MPRASKIIKCVDCGAEHPRKELNRNYRCKECAWTEALSVATELHEHQGPAYEKWKAACEAKASRYLAGIKGGVNEATQG